MAGSSVIIGAPSVANSIRSAFAIVDALPRDHSSGIIGTRLLAHLRLTFDYAAGKVWAEVK